MACHRCELELTHLCHSGHHGTFILDSSHFLKKYLKIFVIFILFVLYSCVNTSKRLVSTVSGYLYLSADFMGHRSCLCYSRGGWITLKLYYRVGKLFLH